MQFCLKYYEQSKRETKTHLSPGAGAPVTSGLPFKTTFYDTHYGVPMPLYLALTGK